MIRTPAHKSITAGQARAPQHTTFMDYMQAQLRDGTPRPVAAWIAAILTHYCNFPGRPCFLVERAEAWMDPRLVNPTTGALIGIRSDWSW